MPEPEAHGLRLLVFGAFIDTTTVTHPEYA
jgi:hypothetical protein